MYAGESVHVDACTSVYTRAFRLNAMHTGSFRTLAGSTFLLLIECPSMERMHSWALLSLSRSLIVSFLHRAHASRPHLSI